MKPHKGVEILSETEGSGELIEKGSSYIMKMQMWLNKGDPVVWTNISTEHPGYVQLSDDRTIITKKFRVDRENLINGIFYGIQGMKVGGTRRLKISPQLAYGEKGIEGIIPPNALLIVEVAIIKKAE